jgi:hypothetical protein
MGMMSDTKERAALMAMATRLGIEVSTEWGVRRCYAPR